MIVPDPLNLVISGVGGQGNVLLSRLLGRAIMEKGYHVSIIDTFGSAQRGGAVNSNVRISKTRPCETIIPSGRAHIIVGLELMETLRMLNEFGNPEVLTLTNRFAIPPLEVLSGDIDYPDLDELEATIIQLSKKAHFVDATDITSRLKTPRSVNIVMLGALAGTQLLPLNNQDLEDEIQDGFPVERVEQNLKAFRQGFGSIPQQCY